MKNNFSHLAQFLLLYKCRRGRAKYLPKGGRFVEPEVLPAFLKGNNPAGQ